MIRPGAITQDRKRSILITYPYKSQQMSRTIFIFLLLVILASCNNSKKEATRNQDIIKPNGATSSIRTDNKRTNSQDSIVDEAVQNVVKTSHIVGLSIGVYKSGTSTTYNYGETEKGKNILPSS